MAQDSDVTLNLDVNTREAVQDLRKFSQATQRSTQKIEKSFKTLKLAAASFLGNLGANAATAAFRAIGSSVSTLASGLVENAQKVETLTTQFEVLTGSVNNAQKAVQDLQEFSAKTPFQLEGLAAASTRLLGFGFSVDQLIPKLEEIGDVAAASGTPVQELALIFGQVSAAGKLTGERLLQLQERAIPIGPAIAETLGIAESQVRDFVSKGKVDFATFEKAFQSLSSEAGFAFGGMAKQSLTLQGVLSTLDDNFSLLQAEIGQALVPALKIGAAELIKLLQAMRENSAEAKTFIAEGLVKIITGIQSGLIPTLATAQQTFLDIENSILDVRVAFKELDVATEEINTSITDTLNVFGVFDENLKGNQKLLEERRNELQQLKAQQEENKQSEIDLNDIVQKSTDFLEGFKQKLNAATAAQKDLATGALEYEDANKKASASIRELTDEQTKLKTETEKILAAVAQIQIGTKAQQELAKVTAALDQTLIKRQDHEAQILELERTVQEEKDLAALDAETKASDGLDKRISAIQEENALLAEIDAQGNSDQIDRNQATLDTLEDNDAVSQKSRLKLTANRLKAEEQLRQKALNAAASLSNSLITLSQGQNRTVFEGAKALGVAQATISTFTGAANAFKDFPFPISAVVAAAVVAAGLVQVSKIQSTSFNAQTGLTEVPQGFPNDSFPANLTSGERVVSAPQNQDLKQFMSDNKGTNVLLGQILGRLGQLETQVNVNIGSQEVVNAVNEGIREGAILEAS